MAAAPWLAFAVLLCELVDKLLHRIHLGLQTRCLQPYEPTLGLGNCRNLLRQQVENNDDGVDSAVAGSIFFAERDGGRHGGVGRSGGDRLLIFLRKKG